MASFWFTSNSCRCFLPGEGGLVNRISMASKLVTPRKLSDSQRNGKHTQRATLLLLACSAGMILFCFMFVNKRTFHDTSSKDFRNFVLQRDASLGAGRGEYSEERIVVVSPDLVAAAKFSVAKEEEDSSMPKPGESAIEDPVHKSFEEEPQSDESEVAQSEGPQADDSQSEGSQLEGSQSKEGSQGESQSEGSQLEGSQSKKGSRGESQSEGSQLEGSQSKKGSRGESQSEGSQLEGSQSKKGSQGESQSEGSQLEGSQSKKGSRGESQSEGSQLEGSQSKKGSRGESQSEGSQLEGSQSKKGSRGESQSEGSQGESQSEVAQAQLSQYEEVFQAEGSRGVEEVLAMPGNDRSSLAGCDLSHGQWVYDDTYPLYRSRNCPFVDTSFRCEENGRPDQNFMKYRWRPHDCDLPRFDPRDMLERLRNQRLVFVGDSLGRNQWESMLCMLSEAVQDKSRVYEANGNFIDKHVEELIFRFLDYNCTVEYYRDPFLVPQGRPPPGLPENVTSILKIDEVSRSVRRWRGANIMIFNSGHWWSWEKIGRPGGRFYMKNNLTEHSNEEAFEIGLKTWALWMEKNLNPSTQVFFRSFAPVHFRGGAWNHGGHCHEEVKLLTDEEVEKEQPIPWTNKHIKAAIEKHIKTKRSAVEFMEVTTLTNYRADAHAGLYGQDTRIHGLPPKHRQDCSHFCLPGVPDTWNEVLYASLLARGQGAWGEPSRY